MSYMHRISWKNSSTGKLISRSPLHTPFFLFLKPTNGRVVCNLNICIPFERFYSNTDILFTSQQFQVTKYFLFYTLLWQKKRILNRCMNNHSDVCGQSSIEFGQIKLHNFLTGSDWQWLFWVSGRALLYCLLFTEYARNHNCSATQPCHALLEGKGRNDDGIKMLY